MSRLLICGARGVAERGGMVSRLVICGARGVAERGGRVSRLLICCCKVRRRDDPRSNSQHERGGLRPVPGL